MQIHLQTETRLKSALSEAVVSGSLAELVRSFGHDPNLISVENLQEIADKLSRVASKEPPWGWRYLRNILNGKITASKKLIRAIMALGASVDGTPELLAKAHSMHLLVVGDVHPGSVILADSRPCANPACPVHFVPRVPWQRYCNPKCR